METAQTPPAGGETRYRPISGQQLRPYRDMRYGMSDVGRAGCEALAAYNCMLLLGRPEPLESVIAFFEDGFRRRFLSGWGLRGRWGAAPWDIRRFLRARGVRFRYAVTLRGLERLVRGPGAVIVSYWNKPFTTGVHTVAVRYDGARFTAYNQNCGSARPVVTDRLGSLMAGRSRFIRGIYIEMHGNRDDDL